MRFDLMTGATTWADAAQRASRGRRGRVLGDAVHGDDPDTVDVDRRRGHRGAHAASSRTGISVAFARSPMVSAGLAWELAENTGGRFRLGLGSQVKAHVERRYGAEFAPPGPRMRDYLRGGAGLPSRVPRRGAPRPRRPVLQALACCRRSGHRAATTSATSRSTCRPSARGCARWRGRWRTASTSTRSTPCRTCTNGSCRRWPTARRRPDARRATSTSSSRCSPSPATRPRIGSALVERARFQIAFYGSTKNYAFQFDDLGFEGTSARLNERMKAGDLAGMAALITDEMLEHFAVVAPWDDLADVLLARYGGVATRLVMYLAEQSIRSDPTMLAALGRGGQGGHGGDRIAETLIVRLPTMWSASSRRAVWARSAIGTTTSPRPRTTRCAASSSRVRHRRRTSRGRASLESRVEAAD